MTNCKTCDKLLSILKDVKAMMDSEQYISDFDSIYDRISMAIGEEN
ncbi:MAG: hypothetical protein E6772_07255 [Dysgonomonas sp.]|nr:hypothetical protein [Dysgonomonas sp.]